MHTLILTSNLKIYEKEEKTLNLNSQQNFNSLHKKLFKTDDLALYYLMTNKMLKSPIGCLIQIGSCF